MTTTPKTSAIGFTARPGLAGALLAVAPFALLPLAAVICLGAGGLALALEARLPEQARLTPA